jgi:protein phosphatase
MARSTLPRARAAALSERGRRRLNEDAVLTAVLGDGAELIAVADGMGGYAAGEVASRRALEVLQARLEAGAELEDAVRAANHAVFTEASTHAHREGMGTTLVALLRRGGTYRIANVGDSRAYRIDGGGLRQITVDHSFVAEAVRSGLLSADEAERSRWRNAVTRAVGTDPDLDEVDCFGPFDAMEQHAVILCTDGLYRAVGVERLQEAASSGLPEEELASALVVAAYDAGSEDNISVAVVRFGAEPAASASPAPPGTASVSTTARAATVASPGATGNGAVAASPPSATPAPAPQYDERPRRHRQHHSRRWTPIELAVLTLGLIAVLVYVAMLALAF